MLSLKVIRLKLWSVLCPLVKARQMDAGSRTHTLTQAQTIGRITISPPTLLGGGRNKYRLNTLHHYKLKHIWKKISGNDLVRYDTKTCQKIDFRMEKKKNSHFFPRASSLLLCIRFVDVAFRSEGFWRREPKVTYFDPATDRHLGGSAQKQQHLQGTLSTSSIPNFIKSIKRFWRRSRKSKLSNGWQTIPDHIRSL